MIIKIFHTYENDFPLIVEAGKFCSSTKCFNALLDNLIIKLSKLSRIRKYSYITRHTDDNIPNSRLTSFKNKFSEFTQRFGENATFGIPTVWFVIYAENKRTVSEIKKLLDGRNVKYFEEKSIEYESIEKIPPDNTYTITTNEAKDFPKFLHQTTQVAIDLLSVPGSINELRTLGSLELMQGNDIESKIAELQSYLKNNSRYYRNHVVTNSNTEFNFWMNFKKVHIKQYPGGYYIYSWSHFLFNTLGVRRA